MKTDNITVNTQSSICIDGSKVLYFDPFQIREENHRADIVLVTHSHYDHFDPESISKIAKDGTVYVVPASMEKELRGAVREGELITVNPGDVVETGGIRIQAVPAYNRLKPFHPKRNQWVGYVVTMDGIRYYAAGDTDAVPELEKISCDVALVPIGGTYTMTAKEAAKLINAIGPKTAIPIHYGSIVGKKEDAEIFREHVTKDIAVEFKL